MHQLTLLSSALCANCSAITSGEHRCMSDLERRVMKMWRRQIIQEWVETRK